MSTELLINTNLIYNEEFARKVIPFMKGEYFVEKDNRVVFEEIESYINRYNNLATKEVLFIELENRTDLTDEEYSKVKSIVENLTNEDSDPTMVV